MLLVDGGEADHRARRRGARLRVRSGEVCDLLGRLARPELRGEGRSRRGRAPSERVSPASRGLARARPAPSPRTRGSGRAARTWPAGTVALGSRTDPAASTAPLPTVEPAGTTQPQPMVHSSASVAPLTELPAPIVTSRPTLSGASPEAVSDTFSCTLLSSPIVIAPPPCARTMAPYHTDAPGISVTGPTREALGATKLWPMVGALPSRLTAVQGIGTARRRADGRARGLRARRASGENHRTIAPSRRPVWQGSATRGARSPCARRAPAPDARRAHSLARWPSRRIATPGLPDERAHVSPRTRCRPGRRHPRCR